MEVCSKPIYKHFKPAEYCRDGDAEIFHQKERNDDDDY